MNILIKLMSSVSLVIAPTLAVLHKDKIQENRKEKIESLNRLAGINAGTAVVEGMNTVTPIVVTEENGKLNSEGDFVYNTGNIQEVKLADKTLALGENSKLYALYNGVKSKDQTLLNSDKWFTIENLFFQSGSSELKPGSETQLNNLAEIMNAYPNMKVKLGGYTDNTDVYKRQQLQCN